MNRKRLSIVVGLIVFFLAGRELGRHTAPYSPSLPEGVDARVCGEAAYADLAKVGEDGLNVDVHPNYIIESVKVDVVAVDFHVARTPTLEIPNWTGWFQTGQAQQATVPLNTDSIRVHYVITVGKECEVSGTETLAVPSL